MDLHSTSSSCSVNIAPLSCTLSNLTVFSTDVNAIDTILSQEEPFSLRVTVEFNGSGAIALMPLAMDIRVDFFAEPYSSMPKVSLGTVTTHTITGVFRYTPTLSVAKAATFDLLEGIYNIGALLRVGVPDWPAFINGFIKGLAIQIYKP